MTVYVAEPKARGKGMTKPQRVSEQYQSDPTPLIDWNPQAIYYSDDPDVDFTPINLEWRALLTCDTDPCTYCRTAPRTIVLEPSTGPFSTEAEAFFHGRNMARKVYGSTHRVTTQSREVGEWS